MCSKTQIVRPSRASDRSRVNTNKIKNQSLGATSRSNSKQINAAMVTPASFSTMTSERCRKPFSKGRFDATRKLLVPVSSLVSGQTTTLRSRSRRAPHLEPRRPERGLPQSPANATSTTRHVSTAPALDISQGRIHEACPSAVLACSAPAARPPLRSGPQVAVRFDEFGRNAGLASCRSGWAMRRLHSRQYQRVAARSPFVNGHLPIADSAGAGSKVKVYHSRRFPVDSLIVTSFPTLALPRFSSEFRRHVTSTSNASLAQPDAGMSRVASGSVCRHH